MSCHSGGFKVWWHGNGNKSMYNFKKHYHSSICSPLFKCSFCVVLHFSYASIGRIRI